MNYTYWKGLKFFLLFTDYNAWNNVEFGYHESTLKIVIKPRDTWDETDTKIFSINNDNTMNALYYPLSDEEFNHIFSCVTVQKI